jgi:phosphoserine aminotransferase
VPSVLDYRPNIAAGSIYNTPPVFSIYATLLVLRWLRDDIGGLDAMATINRRKARILYDALERLDDSYVIRARPRDRSFMNAVFTLRRPEQLGRFLEAARTAGLHGLAGHRSVGGIRASLYNAVSENAVTALVDRGPEAHGRQFGGQVGHTGHARQRCRLHENRRHLALRRREWQMVMVCGVIGTMGILTGVGLH